MKICVAGTGYVELVSGIDFAEVRYHVVCVNVDLEKVDHLLKDEMAIFEPDLEIQIRFPSLRRVLLFLSLSGRYRIMTEEFICIISTESVRRLRNMPHRRWFLS